jgi:amino acid adenylation domain-containing protein/non-ribosomal peptide synthase protein (TIGR01720 family)
MRPPFVHEWFAATAAAHPDWPAIDRGGHTLTYGELLGRSRRLASAISEAVPSGTLVGILSDDMVQVVTAMIAALDADCAFVPLDPANGHARLRTLIEEVDLTWWVGDDVTTARLERIGRPSRMVAIGADIAGALARPRIDRDPDSLCYIYFTSGSTGTPKGIAGRLRAIDHFVRWESTTIGAGPGVRFSQLISPAFDAVLRDIFTPLCTGGVICLPPDRDTRTHAFGLHQWLRDARVNVVHCVPSVLRTLLQMPADECRLPALTHVLTSGEALLPLDVQRWQPRYGNHARLINLYGPSETTMVKFAYETSAADAARQSVPIGRPIDGARAIVVNEHRKVCPPGVAGEIYIRTPYRSLGYYRRPEQTAEVFVPNPFGSDPADLVYRTGDLGRVMPDGLFEFLGRRDTQVKIRGVRVELAEIEHVLRRDPRVGDVAVIDRTLEDESKTLVAFVVLREGAAIDEVKAAASEALPDYMLPSIIAPIARLPRTVSGKVDREALEAWFGAHAIGEDAVEPPIPEPRRPIEEIVAGVWARAFGIERVGLHDDFFQQLGGHSLLATQVLARLQPLFDVPLHLRWLLEHPTVAGLSASIEGAIGADSKSDPEPPLDRVSRARPLPASFAQERLWVIDQLTGTRAYHLAMAVRLRGQLDSRALASAITALAARHESLRTTFGAVHGRPVQQIAPPSPIALPRIDLRDAQAHRASPPPHVLARVLTSVQAAPFDLAQGPLWRVVLLRLDPETHVLAIVVHHIIADGQSMGALMRDVTALYASARDRRPARLAPLPIQYADYAVWQRAVLTDAAMARDVEYWRTQLAAITPLALPTDRPRPAVSSNRGGVAWRTWSPSLSAQVPTWARAHGATVFMVLLAGWQALLARYAGQADVAVGVPIAQRPRAELEPLIGLFVNTLVLRAHVAGAMTWRALVAQVRSRALAAYAHQTTPFERVIEALDPARNLARPPLFQVLFVQHERPEPTPTLADLQLETIESRDAGAKFDLELGVRAAADGLRWRLSYAADLFDHDTAERMLAHLETLVDAALQDPGQSIAALPLLSAAERTQIVTTWNATARVWTDDEAPQPASLAAWLERQASRTPAALAVWSEDEGTWTYAELHARANQLARRLQRLGVAAESRVAVWLPRSSQLIAALVGIIKAGGAYVPLDPSVPAARLVTQLVDVAPVVVITDRAHAAEVPPGAYAIEVLGAPDAASQQESPTAPAITVAEAQLAYLVYTSGSTGQPKGVMNTHAGIVNRLAWMQAAYGLSTNDRVLQKTSIGFDVSVWEIFWPLVTGAAIVVARPGGQGDPEYLAGLIAGGGVTVMHFVPTMLEVFATSGALSACARVRLIVSSGEALPGRLAQRCATMWNGRLENLYGPTEAAIDVTCQACTPEAIARAVVPIGRPIANTQIYVPDPSGEPAPIGVLGELYLGGVQLARGYWGQPALTAERFVPDSCGSIPGARLYRTGDVVRYLPDGAVAYVGRADHQVKLHGNRIELGEIEATLRSLPAVRDAVVVLDSGLGEPRLVAYVVTAATPLDAQHLRETLRTTLPDYMVPAIVLTIDELPLTASGKVDRRALPAPPDARPALAAGYMMPRNAIEATLADAWGQVLRVDRVGVHDNFFALGGDSILALQALARARAAGVHATPRQLFQHQTIADLALIAATIDTRPAATPDTGDRDDQDAPLTSIQRWFFAQDERTVHHFNQSVLLKSGPVLPWIAWEAIVNAILAHHGALRLRFARANTSGVWRQREVARTSQRVFAEVDLRAAGPRWQPLLEAAMARAQTSLNVEQGPLARIILFRGETHATDRLFIVVHHAVIDGVSWRILFDDLHRVSAQWQRGLPLELPEKTAPFHRWAEHVERRRPILEPTAGGHERAIADRQQALRLPRDDEAGANTIGSQRSVTVTLTEEETYAFLHQPPRAYRMQAHEVLIAAVAGTLAAWMQTPDAIVALEGHGRDAFDDGVLDVERTVGCFTTMFPVWLQLPRDGGPGALLREVKEQLRRMTHVAAQTTAASAPMAEVLVNYLGQFDQVFDETGLQLASERMGPARSRSARRPFILELNGGVANNRLSVSFGYSDSVHRPATIATLAQDFAGRLRALVAHCGDVPWAQTTPSDIPLASITQQELDALSAIGGEIEHVYHLSPMQEGLLFHALFDPEGTLYFQQVRVTLEGDLDLDAFQRAWADVVARHAVLRTAFLSAARERPLQVAYARAPLAFDQVDLRALAPASEEGSGGLNTPGARLMAYLEADRARGFQLGRVPLMRLALIRLDDRQWELIWSYHHILLDGWCVPLVLGEVTQLYEGHRTRRPMLLPPVARFSDYIAWLDAQDRAQAEAYWRRLVGGVRAPTSFLPPRETIAATSATPDTDSYGARERRVPANTSALLQRVARQQRVTVNTIVQGAWAVLLSRYSRTRDVIFGATSSGRPTTLSGVESMVGLFISTLPVRVDVDPMASAWPWLRAMQEAQAEARQYEYTPLVDIQRWSELPAGVPLFDSLLAFENYPVNDGLVRGVASFRIAGANVFEKTNYPLTVQVSPASGLSVRILFDGTRVDASTVDRILAHLEQLLAAFATGRDTTLDALTLLSDRERAEILAWNASPDEWAALAARTPASLLERLEFHALATPEAFAVVSGADALTYATLHRRANQLAHALRAEGVGAEVCVAICLDRSPELLVALLAVWKAGGAYVPLDPQSPAARLAHIVRDIAAPVLVTTSPLRERVADTGARALCLDLESAYLDTLPEDPPETEITPASLAYVIYTSGSTGQPKGVGITHGNVASLFAATDAMWRFSGLDTWTLFHSPAFDFSVWEMWGALAYGGRLVIVPRGVTRTPDAFATLLRTEGVTVLNHTPSAFRALQTVDTSGLALRLVIFGGEALPFESVRPWVARHGVEQPALVNMYGITETTVHVTQYTIEAADVAQPRGSRIGRAIPSLRLYVLDAAHQPAPIGVAGEMYVGGAGVARGYLGRPELTAARFVPDPFASTPGARLYRTGDLGRWRADGVCEFVGRADQQIKLRGYRIEPGEIEAALRDQPGVGDALVSLREDVPGERRLVAYVVADPAAETDAAPREWEHRQVSQWEAVFERTYGADPQPPDPTFNIAGWNSSSTGAPIPAVEMREWAEQTVAEIAELQPARVLEIGCGTGLLLFRLAPQCEHYVATDISRTALDSIARQLAVSPIADRVTLLHQTANDVATLADQQFDVVVLNSVVQYFPSVEYLTTVIERAVALVRPGGAIYIGDVRSLALLRRFHASVQWHQAPGWLPREGFERRVERQVQQEEELAIAPELFVGLAERLIGIGQVEIRPKRGRALNEVTKFRYQVVLRVRPPDEPPLAVAWTDWARDGVDLALVIERLTTASPPTYGLARVPNARLEAELIVDEVMAASEPDTILDELRQRAAERATGRVLDAPDLEAVLAIGHTLPYDVIVDWTRHDANGAFDVIFRRRDVRGRWRGWPRDLVATESGAIGTNSASLGQSGRRLSQGLRQGLELRLPSYMVPSAFVVLDRFPVTSNNKIDRAALPPPDFARPELEQAYVAPRTPLESELAQVWAEVLRIQRVGIHDNFFELGGDSIISIQVVARANHAGIPLTAKLLFERQTIAQIAAAADAGLLSAPATKTADAAVAFPPAGVTIEALQHAVIGDSRVEDAYPLSPLQQGMLFHTVSAPNSGVYVAQLRYALAGDVDPQVLREAWQHTVDRHPALRTAFLWNLAAAPLQVVVGTGVPVPWEVYDWRQQSEAERRAAFAALLEADRARGFDLAAPPLMRLVCIRTAERRWQIVWSHHHLLLDGWSLPIVTQDVVRTYAALRQGIQPQLDEPVPYRPYIAWLQQQDDSAAERFWRSTLAGLTRTTPMAAAASMVSTHEQTPQRSAPVSLGVRQTTALKAWARTRHLTLNTVFQALWAIVISRLTDAHDVLFGAVVAGRPPSVAGSDRCVGLFINTLPVRVRVPEDADLDAWLGELQAQQVEQRQHEYVPLVKIKTWSDVPVDVPLFDTLVVFENFPREAISGLEMPGLGVEGVQYHMTESYPLVLAVAPGARVMLDLKYDRSRIEPSSVQRIRARLEAALDLLARGAAVRISHLLQAMDRADGERRRDEQALTEDTAAALLRTTRKRAASRRRVRSEVDDGSGTPTPLT